MTQPDGCAPRVRNQCSKLPTGQKRSTATGQPRGRSRPSQSARREPWRDRVVLNEAQRALVEAHIGLVGLHMRNFVATPLHPMRQREYDDLFQEGCVALARAAASYDASRNGSFASYALLRVRGAIHTALHEYFATIRVPMRKVKQAARDRRTQSAPALHIVQELSGVLAARLETSASSVEPTETIRHLVHARFEWAVELALTDLRQRAWRLRDPTPIMERLAAERLLISTECDRTSLRRIAAETGISSGRACEYEQLLIQTVGRYMADDIRVRLMLRWAKRDARGFNATLDARQQRMLSRADARRFLARFQQLEHIRKAEVVYALVAHSTDALEEVVRNLYRLCGQSAACGFLCVA